MKGNDNNQTMEIRKMLKSRNQEKVYEELESKLNKMTNLQLNQKDKFTNKTFYTNSNDNDNLLTDFMNNKNLSNNKMHKKNLSSNYSKIMKTSTPNIPSGIVLKDFTKNKSNNIQNDFLKKNQLNLKTNKSVNNFVRIMEARSNNVSPFNSSFSKNRVTVKATKINNFVGKNEILETEKDSNHNK